jgi:hypothetical protein
MALRYRAPVSAVRARMPVIIEWKKNWGWVRKKDGNGKEKEDTTHLMLADTR